VTITLAEDVDISRGDLITGVDDAPAPIKEFEATLCWMSQHPMRAGAKYLLRHTTRKVKAIVSKIEYRIDPNTMAKETGLAELKQNDIARVTVKTLLPIACDPYRKNRETGAHSHRRSQRHRWCGVCGIMIEIRRGSNAAT
jgi:sulfate adenylyltransferase subunit 1 (EFTu-like GTPase family)